MSITSMEDLKNKQAEVKKNLDGYTCRVLVCSGTGCIASGAQKIYEEMSRLCEGIEGVAVDRAEDVWCRTSNPSASFLLPIYRAIR